jgi:glutaredoxin-like protein NrdH
MYPLLQRVSQHVCDTLLMITVYVKPDRPGEPDCIACHYTVKFLVDRRFAHTVIEVEPGSEAETEMRRRGVTQMPFVLTSHDSWSGYKREKLKGLVMQHD